MKVFAPIVLTLLLASGLALSYLGAATSYPSVFDSVKPLSVTAALIDPHTQESVIKTYNACTAFSINQSKHLWLTAGHCVLNDDGTIANHPYFLNESSATVVQVGRTIDLAILRSEKGAPALKLRHKSFDWDDVVRVIGHPLGTPTYFVTYGYVASVDNNDPSLTNIVPRIFFNVTVCGGNSGSPVLDRDNKVASVIQQDIGQDVCSSLSSGVTYRNLVAFTESYWEN